MTDTTPAFSGSNNAGADRFELHLRLFAGEVLLAYQNAAKVRPLIRTRTIPFGESAKFAAVGNVPALRHKPGIDTWDPANGFVGNAKFGDQVISIDDPLRAAEVVGRADEAMAEYDVRGPLAQKIGTSLALQDDLEHTSLIALGARTLAGATDDHGIGRVLMADDLNTNVANLKKAIRELRILMDEGNVPDMGRFLVIRPRQYQLLVDDGDFLNRDFSMPNGSKAKGEVAEALGILIVPSNNIPSTSISSTLIAGGNAGTRNEYGGDYTNTVGVAGQTECIGNVMLRGVMTDVESSVARGSDLLVGEILNGKGVLREDSCFELNHDDPGTTALDNFLDLASV